MSLIKIIKSAVTVVVYAVTALALFSCKEGSNKNATTINFRDSIPDAERSVNELYKKIDEEIKHIKKYDEIKYHHITNLKKDLTSDIKNSERLIIYGRLIDEYQYYVCDSALKYVEKAGRLAAKIGNRKLVNMLRIKRGDIAAHAGLFSEAEHILASVPRAELDSSMLENLYWAYSALYKYEYEYLPKEEYADYIKEKRIEYTDSIINIGDSTSFVYLSNLPIARGFEDKQELVKTKLLEGLKKYRSGDRRYSVIAAALASVYEELGDIEQQKRYLALSVLSDIRGAIKQNFAMRDLATVVFNDGDIDRANKFVKVSFSDASFYYSRMQNAQSNEMLPIIDRAYDTQQKKLQFNQKIFIIIISVLLVLAVAAIILVMLQVHKIKEAYRMINKNNDELSVMSAKLQSMNEALENSNKALENTNHKLKTSSRIAEEYAGLFMEYSSLTIQNMQKYHMALRNLALQGNMKGILKKLDSSDVTVDTLKGFYQKFDEAILNIYPQFVEYVNSKLRQDAQILVKPGEKLNTELRILALVKIGITDSEKISEFLRCSIATIYTYRSKLKKRSLNPDNFEDEITSYPIESPSLSEV